jgi:hypothetical protein
VRVEIEDGVAGQRDVAEDERRLEPERGQRLPYLLVNGEPVRVVRNRVEQYIECLPMVSFVDQMPRERKPRAPVLRILRDQTLTEIDETARSAELGIRALQTVKREVGAVRYRLRQVLPRVNGCPRFPCCSHMSPRFKYAGTVRRSMSIASEKERLAASVSPCAASCCRSHW